MNILFAVLGCLALLASAILLHEQKRVFASLAASLSAGSFLYALQSPSTPEVWIGIIMVMLAAFLLVMVISGQRSIANFILFIFAFALGFIGALHWTGDINWFRLLL